MAAYINFS